jgi:hypothetical protein
MMLSDSETRGKGDPAFREVREISHAFQNGLKELFFDSELRDLTVNYGVF